MPMRRDYDIALDEYHMLVNSGMDPAEALNRVGPRIRQGFQPVPTQSERIGQILPLFAERPGRPETTQDIPFHPDRAERGGTATMAPPAPPPVSTSLFSPDRPERGGFQHPVAPEALGGTMGGTTGETAAGLNPMAGNAPVGYPRASPDDRSGLFAAGQRGAPAPGPAPEPTGPAATATITPARPPSRPTYPEVLADPNTPQALLRDVVSKGPAIDKALRGPKIKEALGNAIAEHKANPSQNLFDTFMNHLGPHMHDIEEFKQVMSPLSQVGREQIAARREETRAATEERRLTSDEAKRKDLEAAREEIDRQADEALKNNDPELANQLSLARNQPSADAVRSYSAFYRSRSAEKRNAERIAGRHEDVATTQEGMDKRQKERLQARRDEVEGNRKARSALLDQAHGNRKALIDYRQAVTAGRGDTRSALKMADQLQRERGQLNGQIKSEEKAIENAQLMGEDPYEHQNALQGLTARRDAIDREVKQIHGDIRRGFGQGSKPGASTAPPASATSGTGVSPKTSYDRSRFLKPGATEAPPIGGDARVDEEEP